MDASILIVEDDAAVAMGVSHALTREGWRVHHAPTLQSARQILSSVRTDLVILDIGLPDGSGLELCRELRQESDTPVLFLSARDDELDKVLGLELGGDDYLTKPFSGLMQGQKVRAEAQLRERVPTDYVVDLHPSRGSLPPAMGKEVAGWPEVAGLATVKAAHVSVVGAARVGPMGARSLLLGIAPEQYLSLVGLRTPAEWLDALGAGAVLATRRAAGEFGLQPGDAVTFRRGAGGKTHRFIVAGVIDHEPETSMGAFLVDRRRLDQIDGTDVEHRYLITLNPGTDLNRFERRLKAVTAAASPDIVSQVEEREELARKAAEMLAYVGAMVSQIALIALSSIFNTFMASVRERTKEIGLMRSLGLSRVRLAALIAAEGALMGAIATLVGMALGGLIAFLLGWSLNGEVSDHFLPPLILLGGIPLATLSLSVLSSLWPAWRAGQVPPATLLRSE